MNRCKNDLKVWLNIWTFEKYLKITTNNIQYDLAFIQNIKVIVNLLYNNMLKYEDPAFYSNFKSYL